MYLALFSVVFGSGLTLAQAAALFYVLDIDLYIEYRAVLNTMNVAAPFLCLGFDNSAPVLRRQYPGFAFIWNLLAVQIAAFALLAILAVSLQNGSKWQPLALGLCASTSVAAGLIVANHHRIEGEYRRYFLTINVVDRLVRTLIVIGLALVTHNVLVWALSVALMSFAYVGLMSRSVDAPIQLSGQIFWRQLGTSLPYIFSALGIVALTRLPFFASYTLDEGLVTAKIDIWLLFTLFLLVPVLNKSKIEEAASTGLVAEYLHAMRGSWASVRKQEWLVATGIITVAGFAVLMDKASIVDLVAIVLPLMIGMMLVASVPNYVQLLCFVGKYRFGVLLSGLIALLSLSAYAPHAIFPNASVPWLFVASAWMYCLLGCITARHLDVPLRDFWRWRDVLALSAASAVLLLGATAALSRPR